MEDTGKDNETVGSYKAAKRKSQAFVSSHSQAVIEEDVIFLPGTRVDLTF